MPNDKDQPREEFFINTSPEFDAIERAAADGTHGRNYSKLDQALALRHQVPGSQHWVELGLSPAEQMAGLTVETLESLVSAQNADTAIMFLYVLHRLAPPAGQARPEMASGILDFDEVIKAIGWEPRTTLERREMHKQIYAFVLFGERAQVSGKRRGRYVDKHTGDIIETEIHAAPWRIFKDETPVQKSLFPETEVPVRLEVVVSREWTLLLTSPQTAQYLPLGEVLGAIPGNKPAGAWARVMGLALASFWRRLPRETMDGSVRPTRREILDRYPPKTGLVSELLNSVNPNRAMRYWCDALKFLVEREFIELRGEALLGYEQMKANYPRKGWAEMWLNERIEIYPGSRIRPSVERRVAVLPSPAAPRPKRGRPRKSE